MSSISTDSKGNRILYVDVGGTRRKIALGKISKDAARSIQRHVDAILAARLAGHGIDLHTARWLGEIHARLHERLVVLGLAQPRETAPDAALEAFLVGYLAKRTDIKPGTLEQLEIAKGNLVEFFGAERRLRTITKADAQDFNRWLRSPEGLGLGENTARRRIGRARQFLTYAEDAGLIGGNPFAGLAAAVHANTERFEFIDQATIEKVIAACPDTSWRMIFALCRYGGLRCPSEVLALRWDHILWDQDRMIVPSPKTEHHRGRDKRIIPIFGELRPHLDAAWDAEPDAVFVVSRYRDAGKNLRTHAQRIIESAGVTPWGKTFQNLRSSRETELVEAFPLHVVTAWLGNTPEVARRHYLQTTEEHFRKAVQKPVQSAPEAVQHSTAQTGIGAEKEPVSSRETGSIPTHAQGNQPMNIRLATRPGLEHTAKTPRKPGPSFGDGANSGANPSGDPLLNELLALWPRLSDAQRKALVRMAEGSAR